MKLSKEDLERQKEMTLPELSIRQLQLAACPVIERNGELFVKDGNALIPLRSSE